MPVCRGIPDCPNAGPNGTVECEFAGTCAAYCKYTCTIEGQPCDDGNPLTSNDRWQSVSYDPSSPCFCQGEIAGPGAGCTLTASPTSGPSPLTTTFSLVEDNAPSHNEHRIRFGDGTDSGLLGASHAVSKTYTYNATGTYIATAELLNRRRQFIFFGPWIETVNGTCSTAVSVGVATPTPPPSPPSPPTLDVSLVAQPSTGTAPLYSRLQATVSGTATGTINYTFFWNCGYTGTSVSQAILECGQPDIRIPTGNGVGVKIDGTTLETIFTHHLYTTPGTFTAKVIAERGDAPAAEARTFVRVSPPPSPPPPPPGNPVPPQTPPQAENVRAIEPNYCAVGPSATIQWTYRPGSGGGQASYEVEIAEDGDFNNPSKVVVDSGKIAGTATVYFTGGGRLAYNKRYTARVRVWDASDQESSWALTPSWRTPLNAYPVVSFTWSPANPRPSQSVNFTDHTTFSDSNPGGRTWQWTFGDGRSSNRQNPSHTYTANGTYNVTLTVSDSSRLTDPSHTYSCSLSRPITVSTAPRPGGRSEVEPR